jgi:hypothetical protein
MVVEFVDKLVDASRDTLFSPSASTPSHTSAGRLHRLEKVMKVIDHLTTTNPLKAEREDFIPPLAVRRIEDAAKRNLDLSWALDQSHGKAAAPRIPHGMRRQTTHDSVLEVAASSSKTGGSKGAKGSGGGKDGKGRGRGTGTTPRTESRTDPVSPEY